MYIDECRDDHSAVNRRKVYIRFTRSLLFLFFFPTFSYQVSNLEIAPTHLQQYQHSDHLMGSIVTSYPIAPIIVSLKSTSFISLLKVWENSADQSAHNLLQIFFVAIARESCTPVLHFFVRERQQNYRMASSSRRSSLYLFALPFRVPLVVQY